MLSNLFIEAIMRPFGEFVLIMLSLQQRHLNWMHTAEMFKQREIHWGKEEASHQQEQVVHVITTIVGTRKQHGKKEQVL